MTMLEFQNVSYQYPSEDFDIIDHLSFAVEPGSFHCIIGISGCGKSTIFRMTNGLLKPKAGTILVEGKSIVGRKHYCGYMPQKDLLFPWRTVGENVALPLEIQGERTSSRGMRAWMPPRERSRLCPASHRRTRSSSTVFCSMASRRLWSVKEEGGRRPSGGYSLFSGIL